MTLRPADWTQTPTSSELNNPPPGEEISPLDQRRKLRSYTSTSKSTTASREDGSTDAKVTHCPPPPPKVPAAGSSKKKSHTRHSAPSAKLPMPLEKSALFHQGLTKLAETYNIPDIAAALELSLKSPLSPARDGPSGLLKRPAEPTPSEAWVQKRLKQRQRAQPPTIHTTPSSSPSTSKEKEPEKCEGSVFPRGSTRDRMCVRDFGKVDEKGRHYCTFVDPTTNQVCDTWKQGYTTWSDLARHVDAKHAPAEMEMMKQGLLTFETTQWIKSENQLDILKQVCCLTCPKCGTSFGSGRYDSLSRHKGNGACERALKRQKSELSNGFRIITPPKTVDGQIVVDEAEEELEGS